MIFIIFLVLGGNISCVTLFYNPVQEYFREIFFDEPDREAFGEPTSMPGDKYLCF